MSKKSLLYMGDTPNVSTGFGNVARHVLSRVLDRYDITVFGVNEYFTNPKPLPVTRVIPALPNAANDPFGRQKFVDFVVNNKPFDIWFLQNDIHSWGWLNELMTIIRARGNSPHVFSYTVVDAPIRQEDTWFLNSVDYAGIPSQYGVDEILKKDPNLAYKIHHIPHGIDTKEFFPLPKEAVESFRINTLRCQPNNFLILNVNRNSLRKQLDRTLLYFGCLHRVYPNTKLYLHMEKNEENYRGWDFTRVIGSNPDLFNGIAFPGDFSVNQGVSADVLNLIYNAADMVISTTAGEGFGLSCIEAMAAKTLVMMPDNSSISELLRNNRGLAIKCGTTSSEWTIHSHDTGMPRPLCNIDDMIQKTEAVLKNRPTDMIDCAYRWVTTDLNWNKVIKLFIEGFENEVVPTTLGGGISI